VAFWAFDHRQPAGRGTATLPASEGLHLPLLAGERGVGVLSLRFHDTVALAPAQRDLIDTFTRQIALVLDRQRLREAEEGAKLLAESERLSKTLLNSISHEMRTPITAIAGAASSLSEGGGSGSPEFQQVMVSEIQEAAGRLNRLVGNLLNMTRLEAGFVKARMDWCDVSDLVQVTLKEVEKDLARHKVAVEVASGLPLVRMDFVLMQQALTNLLLNAATHTPPGTAVQLKVTVENKALAIAVADTGPGLAQDTLEHIFDKFYRAPAAAAGGTGLGLSIVKGFTEAQGGRVEAVSQLGAGAVFTLRLPLSESPPATPEGSL
jgi:two-component system sensor histidine kinase KdpD